VGTRKHTTLNLDTDLVKAAQDVLGTTKATDTIHQALAEVVNRRRRQRLAARDLPGLTPESLEETRKNRTFGDT
jgi:Arc/MetJ family transcription regulator